MFLHKVKLKQSVFLISNYYVNNTFNRTAYLKSCFKKSLHLMFLLKKCKLFSFNRNIPYSLVILNLALNNNFNLNVSLKKFYFGIGLFLSSWFCYLGGGLNYIFLTKFKKEGILNIQSKAERMILGDDFKKILKDNYLIWKDLYHFQSLRKKKGLPIRGQSSRSNSKTSKKNIFLKSIGGV